MSSSEVEAGNGKVDQLDADERRDQAAETVDCEIAREQRTRADRAIFHALQRERDQAWNDQRVENQPKLSKYL